MKYNLFDIKDPVFLSNLNNDELVLLSKEIRKFLLFNISKTGGHLSSNLGIVDLTIAIHKVFNSRIDKIIFDVGHQAYTHKILTGRGKDFKNLRQYKGLSGFQKANESVHDVYEAGHSSTSLSAGLGFALSRDMNKDNYKVVTVIGDASISNGLSFEALNHIGSVKSNMLIILNDNEMSISKNVGAIHNMLDKIRVKSGYKNAKNRTKKLLDNIPLVGIPFKNFIEKTKNATKKIYSNYGYVFEELGIRYYGPINGHDYREMISYLEMLKNETGPVLLHVITKKGKGYKYAELDTEGTWHGVGPFDLKTGEFKTSGDKISWSEIISKHITKLAEKDSNIIVISPSMTNGSKLKSFKEKYPDRFIDVGIAEEHALILANSLAINGKKPFVSIYSSFLQRGYDEVLHDIARMNTGVVIGIDRAGLSPEDGETHHGVFDISFLSHIPNIIIMSPKDSNEALNMLYTAFNNKLPVAIRYSKQKLLFEDSNPEIIELGKWEAIKKGNDIAIIAYGDYIEKATEISKKLEYKNVSVEIVNARFIKPFDKEYLADLFKTNKKIFVYEETQYIGSLGQNIISYANELGYKGIIHCFSIEDRFIMQGDYDSLLKECLLDIESVYNKILTVLDK